MSSFSHIRSRIEFIASMVDPHAWELVEPHGLRKAFINDHYVELMVAETVRDISGLITDPAQKKAARKLSAAMGSGATKGLVDSWEDGDPICPPFPWERLRVKFPIPNPPEPDPFPWIEQLSEPEPSPWRDGGPAQQPVKGLAQLDLAASLVQLSSLTLSAKANKELVGIAAGIGGGISKSLAEDIDRCGTVPRKPWPRPHAGGPLVEAATHGN